MLFHITRIECFSIWVINMMEMGQLELQCVQNRSIGESIICLMWWTCPSTTKQHGNANLYPKWVNKGCGHRNTKSFNGKRICFDISSGRGLKFHPPNNIEGPTRFTNNNTPTFRHVSLFEGLNSTKKKRFGQEVANFLLWGEHSFKYCVTPNVHKSCESNL
jgi:hypothetical protein